MPNEHAELSPLALAQQGREDLAQATAEAKLAALPPIPARAVQEGFERARRAPRAGKRLRLVLEAADAVLAPVAPLAACRAGCHHCCSLPSILIMASEARRLAQISGRPFRVPEGARSLSETLPAGGAPDGGGQLLGAPCPFLVGGRCSVYADRPLTCRTHLNLDDDALLCERDPGRAAAVPYFDARAIWLATLTTLPDEPIADIREFFAAAR